MLTTSQMNTLNRNVAEGVKFLNKKYPDWRTKDWSGLDVQSRLSCPLSLTVGTTYATALERAGLTYTGGIDLGFWVPEDFPISDSYKYLKELWMNEHDRTAKKVSVDNDSFFADKEIGIAVDGVQVVSIKVPASDAFARVSDLKNKLEKILEDLASES